ncbi:hypothetical protein SAMN05216275_14121 [Streptosporangium canum]|uniref:Uncharacterized protein n=1 Tax=Streptosporangium canum TaxID=324952 RepID=A0A1I4DIA4_9ACTN|nr:hypothetical protein [Streptosporangium canum]SFK91796.1 hypothetical protein SAMN05216275_14121 [Streptosporangium canum]
MSTPLTPPTPEDVATMASDALHIYGWDLSQDGNVVEIGIGPFGADDKPLLPGMNFQAHVFQVPPAPPIAAEGVDLDVDVARELAYTSIGKTFEGWTVVEREDIDTSRWESHHWLVIRSEAGEHFGATYSKGLTEYQDTRPWECDTIACFEPIARQTRVVQVHEWVTRADLIKLHEYDELIFGGVYCTHCTPDDCADADDNVMWPCPPLRAAGVTDDEAIEIITARRAAIEKAHRASAAQGEAKTAGGDRG